MFRGNNFIYKQYMYTCICTYFYLVVHDMMYKLGSATWDERKEGGWKERMDDWKLQQGNLGQEIEDLADPDMAMYVSMFINALNLLYIVRLVS